MRFTDPPGRGATTQAFYGTGEAHPFGRSCSPSGYNQGNGERIRGAAAAPWRARAEVEAAGIERVEADHELADLMGFVEASRIGAIGLRRFSSVLRPKRQAGP